MDTENKDSKQEQPELTPWQEAHKEYYESIGETPLWQNGQEDDVETSEEQNEVPQPEETVDQDGDPLLKRKRRRKKSSAKVLSLDGENAPTTDGHEEETLSDTQEVEYKSFASELPKVKKQKNARLRKQLITIVSVFLAGIFIALYVISPFSKVGKIVVTGTSKAEVSKIEKDSGVRVGESLWTLYTERNKVSSRVQKGNVRVKSVAMSFSFVNTITLTVKEFEEIAYELNEKKYHVVLENGAVIQDSEIKKRNKKLPVLLKFEGDQKRIAAVAIEYKKLPSAISKKIEKVTLTPTPSNADLVTMDMVDGNKVKISIEDITKKMKYYTQVAKDMKEKGIVDMEVAIFSYPYSMEAEENKKVEESHSSKSSTSSEQSSTSTTTSQTSGSE